MTIGKLEQVLKDYKDIRVELENVEEKKTEIEMMNLSQ